MLPTASKGHRFLPLLWLASAACLCCAGARAARAQGETWDDERIERLYAYFEAACLKKGWTRVFREVEGRKRKLLWKGPAGAWTRGTIVALHGGGGVCSNFGAGPKLGKPMERFSELAISRGYAVFSLDSTDGVVTDPKGLPCGKRWDCTATTGRPNVDVPFIEDVIEKVVPALRPEGSAEHVFLTGISNGGFMTILAASRLPGLVTAFAPVSAGDPYGTVMDMATHPRGERRKAPGVFRDAGTGKLINDVRSAEAARYANEAAWPDHGGKALPRFRSFHHVGDGVCDVSCMEKARYHLVLAGFRDQGPYLLPGRRSVWNHFWQEAYNRPILDFFHRAAKAEPKAPAYDRPGPHAVETLDFPGLRDQARDSRRVPVKVHAPRGAGPFPLVVFSHGGGGNRDSYVYLVRHLASHGYVVACPEHVFSNAAILRHYLGPAGGSMKFMESLQRITTDPRAVLERPRDVSFAIDRAVGWNRSHSRLKGRIDCSKVGVMGHSYGAYTALVVCGAKPLLDHLVPAVAPGKGLAKDDLRDGRVTFGVALSQQGPGTTFFGPESFKSIDRPLLCVSGTKDVMKGDRGQTLPAAARLAAFRDLYPAGGRSLLWLHGADHFAFADSTKAYLMPSPSRPDVQRIARAFLVAASHAHLRGDKEARKRLGRDYAGTLLGPVVDGAHWHEK